MIDLFEFIKAIARAHWHAYGKYVYHILIIMLLFYLIIKN